jgi:hypothetical protein
VKAPPPKKNYKNKGAAFFVRDVLSKLKRGRCYDHDTAYACLDYAGKITPRAADETCSDAFGKRGISCHMMTVVGLIPPEGTAAYTKMVAAGTFADMELELCEEGEYYMLHCHSFCDDGKQTGFHTLSNFEASISQFDKLLPWVNSLKVQSDGASNYHHPYLIIGLRDLQTRIKITEYNFSAAGEGKDLCDMDTNTLKRGLNTQRDAGMDTTTAHEMVVASDAAQEHARRQGAVNIEINLSRSAEVSWKNEIFSTALFVLARNPPPSFSSMLFLAYFQYHVLHKF